MSEGMDAEVIAIHRAFERVERAAETHEVARELALTNDGPQWDGTEGQARAELVAAARELVRLVDAFHGLGVAEHDENDDKPSAGPEGYQPLD